jgi:quercetin dioxygenase-like cupin family protein
MAAVLTVDHPTVHLLEAIEYPAHGVQSKFLLEDTNCRYTLMTLAKGTQIAEHTAARNAVMNVLSGNGLLTLEEKVVTLEPGVLVFMPMKARHAIQASQELAFLLILSE